MDDTHSPAVLAWGLSEAILNTGEDHAEWKTPVWLAYTDHKRLNGHCKALRSVWELKIMQTCLWWMMVLGYAKKIFVYVPSISWINHVNIHALKAYFLYFLVLFILCFFSCFDLSLPLCTRAETGGMGFSHPLRISWPGRRRPTSPTQIMKAQRLFKTSMQACLTGHPPFCLICETVAVVSAALQSSWTHPYFTGEKKIDRRREGSWGQRLSGGKRNCWETTRSKIKKNRIKKRTNEQTQLESSDMPLPSLHH